MTDLREEAIRRLREKRGFRQHLVVYGVINSLLVVIWAVTWTGYFWPVWPIAGWGVGLALHGWFVFGDTATTEKEIRREMERLGDSTTVTDP